MTNASNSAHYQLDSCIIQVLAEQSPLSAQELTAHLQHKRESSVNTALNVLLMRGQVQRVGISDRFRLSPTQAMRCAELLSERCVR